MSAAVPISSALDRALFITFFPSSGAKEKREETLSLRAVAPRIRTTTSFEKARLPWLKLARFGDKRTDKQSLRNNENVLAISGIEGDYDTEVVTVDEAVALLKLAGLAGMIYTSPSHTEDAPRWRVLCPLSIEHQPSDRLLLLSRLNGVFHGGLSGESFTLSQSYYFGCINRSPSHRVELVDGDYLDNRADLDEVAIGKPRAVYIPGPVAALSPQTGSSNRYVQKVIDSALSRVRNAVDGTKHHTLRNQARLLGGFQHAGHYSTQEAMGWLLSALPASVKDRKAAETTALWGLEQGAAQPLEVPERATSPQQEPPPDYPDDPGPMPEPDSYEPIDNVFQFPSGERQAQPEPYEPKIIPVIRWHDIEPTLATADLVEDVLGTGAMSVIYGESNSGKTFFATNAALHVACGWEWCGRQVERMGVIYCALEGSHGIKNRVAAFKMEHALSEHDIPFGIVAQPLALCQTDDDTHALIAAIKKESADLDIPVGWVIMDTLARAIAGGNENAPDDMGSLVRNGDLIRSATGAHLTWIHHSGKDQAKGARGHSSLRAATDTEIEISVEGNSRTARVTKQREYECNGEFSFSLKTVELGANARGKMVTSCVVEHQGDQPKHVPKQRLSAAERRALDVLNNVIASSGRQGDPGVPSGCSSVPEKWWRDAFYESANPGDTLEAKQTAFRRASKTLISNGIVGMGKGRLWCV